MPDVESVRKDSGPSALSAILRDADQQGRGANRAERLGRNLRVPSRGATLYGPSGSGGTSGSRVVELTKSSGTGQGCPTSSLSERTRGRALCPLSSGMRINRDAELTGPSGSGGTSGSRVGEQPYMGRAAREEPQGPESLSSQNRRAPVRGARRRVCQKGLGAERSVRYPQGCGSTGTRS